MRAGYDAAPSDGDTATGVEDAGPEDDFRPDIEPAPDHTLADHSPPLPDLSVAVQPPKLQSIAALPRCIAEHRSAEVTVVATDPVGMNNWLATRACPCPP